MRCRYHALLQLTGFLAIVAFHCEVTWMSSGWFAVELFFALAGYNMAGALRRESPFGAYAWARYRRLALPLLLLLPAVAVLVVRGSRSAAIFAASAPLQLHNVLRPLMTDTSDLDMVWLPTWFVAALFQLQLLALLARHVLVGALLLPVLGGAAILGLVFRLALGRLLSADGEGLSLIAADALYWAPITHVEALVGGALLGLGRLSIRGNLLVALIGGVAVPVAVQLFTEPVLSPLFPLGIGESGAHVWGYLALAAGMLVVIDKRQPLARWVLGLELKPGIDRFIESASQLTFVAYLLHGTVLAALTYGLRRAPGGAALLSSSAGNLLVAAGVAAISLAGAAGLARLLAVRRAVVASPQ